MQSPYGNSLDGSRFDWVGFLIRHIPLLLFLVVAFGGMVAVYWFFSPPDNDVAALTAVSSSNTRLSAAIHKPIPSRPVIQRLVQSPGPVRVALIVGHKDSDSGAVCEDGLTELEINANIAQMVADRLNGRGVQVELLAEFDPRLDSYSGTAVVSLHADSCEYINEEATGFKIAGSAFTDSSGLSICVEQAYADATKLPYHANTITPHMTDYHAFRKIAPGTPAIILETGFMNQDRNILTIEAEKPANGIATGILCFLNDL
ncbi:MAG: N-acetylmuramoyl-L-alanine amidase [Chloroflexota bacterium]